MKIFGLAGWSGSGKTTLLVNLLPILVRRGIRVSTLKHAHHDFDVDRPGKDSYRHREAGATEVMISSGRRWALMHELRGEAEAEVDDLIRHMSPVDLLLIEGYKRHAHDKLEVWRASVGKPLMALEDKRIVAVAAERGTIMPGNVGVPVIDIDDVEAIAAFVIAHCRLAVQPA